MHPKKKRQKHLISEYVSDHAFKRAHPFRYWGHIAVCALAILLPIGAYAFGLPYLTHGRENGWVVLGLIGAFFISAGLASAIASAISIWDGFKAPKLLILACFAVGALLIGVMVFMLRNDTAFNAIDQHAVTYYFCTHLFLLFMLIYYVRFHGTILCVYGRHIGKRRMNGLESFWERKSVHAALDIKWLQWLNRIYIAIFLIELVVHLLFGWIKSVAVAFSFFFAILALMTIVLFLAGEIIDHKRYHEHAFVLLARSRDRGLDSSLVDLVEASMIALCAYAQMSMAFERVGVDIWLFS